MLTPLEETAAVPARSLGRVHGAVRVAHDVAGLDFVGANGGDADAGSDHRPLNSWERPRDGVEQAQPEFDGLLRFGHTLSNHDELVAAKAPDEVLGPDCGRQTLADLAEHVVGTVVAEGVIQGFQPIQVDEQDGRHGAGDDALYYFVEPFEDGGPVRKTGQAVVTSVSRQPLEVSLPLNGDAGNPAQSFRSVRCSGSGRRGSLP